MFANCTMSLGLLRQKNMTRKKKRRKGKFPGKGQGKEIIIKEMPQVPAATLCKSFLCSHCQISKLLGKQLDIGGSAHSVDADLQGVFQVQASTDDQGWVAIVRIGSSYAQCEGMPVCLSVTGNKA